MYHAGKITCINDDGSYDIKYDASVPSTTPRKVLRAELKAYADAVDARADQVN